MTEATQQKLQRLVRELSRLIRAEADNRLNVKKTIAKADPKAEASEWLSACLDTRWFSEGGGFTAKLRVVLPNSDPFSIQVSFDIEDVLHKLSNLRKGDSSVDWYGLKVILTPDGVVSSELNTDPNCVVDPTWFKS